MKERIYIIIDLDESDPEESIVAIMNNHAEAERTKNNLPTRNLVVTEREVYGSFDKLENDLEF